MRQELTKRESKAETTDREARAIIAAEKARRNAKTEALRQARLQRDAAEREEGAEGKTGLARAGSSRRKRV